MKFASLFVLALVSVLGVRPVLAESTPGPVHLPALTNTVATAPDPAPALAQTTVPSASSPAQSTADKGDIHDIRGPISIPNQWLWAAYIAGGLVVLAALYGFWRWFRTRAKIKAKLPFEIALERLEAARALMTPDTVRDYAFTASEIIRVYIEQRFGEKAAHRTTDEFLSDLLLQTGTPLAQHRRRLEDFLSHCDLSKFARWQFSVREMESMHESAREFVLETKPRPEALKVAVPAGAAAQPELVQAK